MAAAVCAAVSACGSSDDFRVLGTVENLGTQNLRVVYRTDKGVESFTTTAIDGQFSFTGQSPKETLVEVFTTDRAPLGYVVIKNGQTVKARFNRDNRYDMTLKGNGVSSDLAGFMRDNAGVLSSGSDEEVNGLVAEYVGDHTGDMVSTVLLLTQFRAGGHEAEADSLFDLIDHEARPGYLCDAVRGAINERLRYDLSTPVVPFDMFTSADTLMSFNPQDAAVSMLVFTSRESERDREFVGAVGDIYRKHKGEPEVCLVDISLSTDTAAWHASVAGDSARWVQAWVPGGVAAPGVSLLRIPRTPYYVVADSAGTQIYRGPSMDEAAGAVDSIAAARAD